MVYDAVASLTQPGGRVLTITRHHLGERTYSISLDGELDLGTAVDFRAEISALLDQQPRPNHIEVDLSRVAFVDSLGLGTLVVARRICTEMGVRMRLRNPSPFVTRLLTVSGLGEQPIGAQSLNHQTVGHQTVGHETVGHETVGHETVSRETVSPGRPIPPAPSLPS